jgi:hypothetical protein
MLWFSAPLKWAYLGMISEGQLIVWIRQIKSENENIFGKLFPSEMFGCKSKFYEQIIASQKKVLCFCKCEINSIYKVTSVRIVEIEEASPPLEEDRGDLG